MLKYVKLFVVDSSLHRFFFLFIALSLAGTEDSVFVFYYTFSYHVIDNITESNNITSVSSGYCSCLCLIGFLIHFIFIDLGIRSFLTSLT